MNIRAFRRFAPATAIVAALVIPVAVLAGNEAAITELAPDHTTDAIGPVQVSSKQYQVIPGLADQSEIDYEGAPSLTVSVDMKQGSARLQPIDPNNASPEPLTPESVLLSGKGIQSYTFISDDITDFELRWKRVGDKTAKAASMTVEFKGLND